jgi:hypothetical protein
MGSGIGKCSINFFLRKFVRKFWQLNLLPMENQIFLVGTLLQMEISLSNPLILSCMINITLSQQSKIVFNTSGLGKAQTGTKHFYGK